MRWFRAARYFVKDRPCCSVAGGGEPLGTETTGICTFHGMKRAAAPAGDGDEDGAAEKKVRGSHQNAITSLLHDIGVQGVQKLVSSAVREAVRESDMRRDERVEELVRRLALHEARIEEVVAARVRSEIGRGERIRLGARSKL